MIDCNHYIYFSGAIINARHPRRMKVRKNIILKSMLRQPIRTGLLIILIGIATFAFFMRTVEYITVRRQLHELNQLYRTIGFIRAGNWEDVSAAADIIENSPLVGFVDRRVGMEGVLKDIQNVDIAGMWRGLPNEHQSRITEAVFSAQLNYVNRDYNHMILLDLQVKDVYFGYNEHVSWGQSRLRLELDLYPGMDTSFIDEMELGEVYVFRGAYYRQFAGLGIVLPRPHDNNPLTMRPLHADGRWVEPIAYYDKLLMHLRMAPWGQYYGINPANMNYWHYNIPYEIWDEITFFGHHHSVIDLVFTTDMSSMPHMQRGAPLRMGLTGYHYAYLLRDGRMPNYNDYLNANPVVAISTHFAFSRWVMVGHTISVSIPSQQLVTGSPGFYTLGSVQEEEYEHVLELEVIGIFDHFGGLETPFFLPKSLIPEGIVTTNYAYGWNYPYHMPSDWFSFVLADSRYEQEFIQRYRERLNEMDLDIVLFETESAEFLAAIEPILLTITFNAAVFWMVLVLVLTLVVFLVLQQRKKDMAIQQGLGFTARRVTWRLVVTVLMFSAPAIAVGGVLGWRIAHDTAEYTLSPLSDIIYGFEPNVYLETQWFVILTVAVFVILLAFLLVSAIRMSFVPVLNQLQGVWRKMPKEKPTRKQGGSKAPEPQHLDDFKDFDEFALPEFKQNISKIGRLGSGLRWIMRQIYRAPVKSALGLLVALFFVLVLGWLQESVMRAEQGLEDLYNNTVVYGQVTQDNPFDRHHMRYLGDVIRRETADAIRDSGFAENLFIEAGHFRSFVIPYQEGGLPRDWYEIIGYDRRIGMMYNIESLDFIYAFNDIDIFIDDNYLEGFGGLVVEFAPGYYRSDFVFVEDESIPIIVPERVLERRGVATGDRMILAVTMDSPNQWRHTSAHIIGVHNGHI